MFRKNLFVPGKWNYIRGKKPRVVDCILCGVLNKDSRVENLLVWEDDVSAVSVNLYPYNAGHLLIFPKRHILYPRQLTEEETMRLNSITKKSLDILDELYQPEGYNIGYNIGEASGASIRHLHLHMVPRYPKELGFVDVIGGTKIIIEDPAQTMEKLKKAFAGLNFRSL